MTPAHSPEPPLVWHKRPLTLEELESLHGAELRWERIPGLPRRLPWLRLLGVALLCALIGFAIALIAQRAGLDASDAWARLTAWLSSAPAGSSP